VIVAIDGPAGAGKSSTAQGVAAALGFAHLDSGAMYRAVALASIQQPACSAADLASKSAIELGERVLLDGRDVTAELRSPSVSARASEIAADPAVRTALVARQRDLLARGDWVAEGRDIGSVVVPGAAVKVFLTASEDERARRRAAESGEAPAAVLAEQRDRDERDSSRTHSPLVPAPDAVVIDTTTLSLDVVVAQIAALAGRG
jgi:cytidylate kinase